MNLGTNDPYCDGTSLAKSVTDETTTHTYIQKVIFTEGQLNDVTLGLGWGAGAYACRLPWMKHSPYVARNEGCYQFPRICPAKE